MDLQYYGGNCIVLSDKKNRIVIDDNLKSLGLKQIAKDGDVLLFTNEYDYPKVASRLTIDGPGEYEVSEISIVGIAARAHTDEAGAKATIYKIVVDDVAYLVVGHVYPALTDEQLEAIGMIDVMCIPAGGHGYTLDAVGALQLVKAVEPRLVVPTHYADSAITYPIPQEELANIERELGLETLEAVSKLKVKPGELDMATKLQPVTRA